MPITKDNFLIPSPAMNFKRAESLSNPFQINTLKITEVHQFLCMFFLDYYSPLYDKFTTLKGAAAQLFVMHSYWYCVIIVSS